MEESMRTVPSVVALLAVALLTAAPAHALIGLNQCGAGAFPPAGIHCGHDDLLLGYRNAPGACVWVCCPPNSDGQTYNCSAEPTPSDYKLDLEKVWPRPWKGVFTPGTTFEKPE